MSEDRTHIYMFADVANARVLGLPLPHNKLHTAYVTYFTFVSGV